MKRVHKQKIIVLGGGNSGAAAAELALKNGAETVLLDTSPTPKCADELNKMGIHCFFGDKALEYDSSADMAIISPGVPKDSPLAALGRRLAPKTIGELAFGASFLDIPMLAVTGTNGKTTTVEMLTHILNGCGIETLAAGNIGLPLSRVALQQKKPEAAVVEISSFQLEHADGFKPEAAALLNITPDHQERHHTPEEYARLKLSLCDLVRKGGMLVINGLLEKKYSLRKTFSEHKVITFGPNGDFRTQDDSIAMNGNVIAMRNDFMFSGVHNLENAAAAAALAGQLGIPAADAAEKLRTFKAGDHRLQTVLVNNGIRFVDDSKATNVDAMMAALKAIGSSNNPTALIAGGLDKNCKLDEAMELLSKQVMKVFLIGNCAERLRKLWSTAVACEICSGMEEAVFKAADSLEDSGGTVLLSPACASMDMFRDYADRGDCFRNAAMKYAAKSGSAKKNAIPG